MTTRAPTPPLDADTWSRVSDVLDGALAISDESERRAYIETTCGGDERVRAEVESLLVVAHASETLLPATAAILLVATGARGRLILSTTRISCRRRGLGSNGTKNQRKPYQRFSVSSSQAPISTKQLRMSASWLISVSRSCTLLSSSSSLRYGMVNS